MSKCEVGFARNEVAPVIEYVVIGKFLLVVAANFDAAAENRCRVVGKGEGLLVRGSTARLAHVTHDESGRRECGLCAQLNQLPEGRLGLVKHVSTIRIIGERIPG